MNHRLNRSLAFTLLALVLVTGLSYVLPVYAERITILHTNDHHGAFWENERGEFGLVAQAPLKKTFSPDVSFSQTFDRHDLSVGRYGSSFDGGSSCSELRRLFLSFSRAVNPF